MCVLPYARLIMHVKLGHEHAAKIFACHCKNAMNRHCKFVNVVSLFMQLRRFFMMHPKALVRRNCACRARGGRGGIITYSLLSHCFAYNKIRYATKHFAACVWNCIHVSCPCKDTYFTCLSYSYNKIPSDVWLACICNRIHVSLSFASVPELISGVDRLKATRILDTN